MGIGIAIPLQKYIVMNCFQSRISDTVQWPSTARSKGFSVAAAAARLLSASRALLFWRPTFKMVPTTHDTWVDAKRRFNHGVLLGLTCRTSGAEFCVGTYHMPCQFRNPPVMVIHAALVAQWMQKKAAARPLVFCGDFNVKPGDSGYRLLTEGTLSKDDVHYPQAPPHWINTPNLDLEYPFESVYKRGTGSEPDFTNWAHCKRDAKEFVATLDYIFVSPAVNITSVKLLAPRTEAFHPGPYPTKEEPSDHLLLACDVTIKQQRALGPNIRKG